MPEVRTDSPRTHRGNGPVVSLHDGAVTCYLNWLIFLDSL
jgi:hypothetical protein